MLNKQSRLFKNYKTHGYKTSDKARLDAFSDDCKKAIEKAKQTYLQKLGSNLADPLLGRKTYWKMINKIMNKCKAPKIPPIFSGNSYILNCKDKACAFATFFADQCKPLVNNSTLPPFHHFTESRLGNNHFI